jgi:hypothetical protein
MGHPQVQLKIFRELILEHKTRSIDSTSRVVRGRIRKRGILRELL